jgi:DNA-binding transcriptional regulator LsrR (DeoR family)
VDLERLELLVQIATWYYEEDLSQEDIAGRVGLSRSMVSRLLQKAREHGLIEIRVRYPLIRDTTLEQRLCRTFSLTHASVLRDSSADHATLLRRVGELGTRHLQRLLHDEVSIGVGWGTWVYAVVRAMPVSHITGAKVIQLIGSIGSGDPTVDGAQTAHWLAQSMGAVSHFLHAPLIVENEETRRALSQDPVIASTLALAREVEVALVGVGAPDPALSGMRRAGYFSAADLARLRKAGAVGDIVGYHLDAYGCPLDVSINRRLVGISLETLRSIPVTIVAAAGASKAAAILAVLRGGYADVLATDAVTASAVLNLQDEWQAKDRPLC